MKMMSQRILALTVAMTLGGGQVLALQPGTDTKKPEPAKEPAKTEQPKTEPAKTEPAKPEGAKAQPAKPETPAAKPADAPIKEKFVYVNIKTSMGEIVVELNNEKAPISVENFLKYTDAGHYDGTIFHRVIDGFMIQGGGYTASDLSKPKSTNPPIKNEWENGLKNKRGTLAMARLGDGKPNPSTVNSATSQFFINVNDNDFLDKPQRDGGAYAVFGQVVVGMDVVDKIKAVKTTMKNGMGDVPVQTVTIEKVRRSTPAEVEALKAKK